MPYQYNAVNNIRVADLICKVCVKREKQEKAAEVKAAACAAIVPLPRPEYVVVNPTTLIARFLSLTPGTYSAIRLFYSDDFNHPRAHEKTRQINAEETETFISLDNLTPKTTYYLTYEPHQKDLIGAASVTEKLIMEHDLAAPEEPVVSITFRPLLVKLTFPHLDAKSKLYADRLNVYYRHSDESQPVFLISLPPTQNVFHWADATLGDYYSFATTLSNHRGDSAFSAWTALQVADAVPLPPVSIVATFSVELTDDPNAPRNIKATVKFGPSVCVGAAQLEEIQVFKTRVLQEGKGPDDLIAMGPGVAGRTRFSPPSSDGTAKFVIDHLLPAQDYFFAGRARNKIGWSPWTNFNWARTGTCLLFLRH